MAKVKMDRALAFNNGKSETIGGAVFHRTRWGVTARTKGSALGYAEGCTFGPAPPAPPPVPTFWSIRVDGYGYMGFLMVLDFTVRRFDEVRGEFTHRESRYYGDRMVRQAELTVISLYYDKDNLTKVYRVILETEGGGLEEDIVTISVPPFNGDSIGPGDLDKEDFVAQ